MYSGSWNAKTFPASVSVSRSILRAGRWTREMCRVGAPSNKCALVDDGSQNINTVKGGGPCKRTVTSGSAKSFLVHSETIVRAGERLGRMHTFDSSSSNFIAYLK